VCLGLLLLDEFGPAPSNSQQCALGHDHCFLSQDGPLTLDADPDHAASYRRLVSHELARWFART
jgi:hypothetical protein